MQAVVAVEHIWDAHLELVVLVVAVLVHTTLLQWQLLEQMAWVAVAVAVVQTLVLVVVVVLVFVLLDMQIHSQLQHQQLD
jgi:hypothetical protein